MAIVSESLGTVALRLGVDGRRKLYVGFVTGYGLSFVLLAAALRHGIGIAAAYSVWVAAGVAVIAVLGHWVFGERLNRIRLIGIICVLLGVALISSGANS